MKEMCLKTEKRREKVSFKGSLSVAQQCPLEAVSFHVCPAFCEVASPPRSGDPTRWLQPYVRLMTSKRESFVKLLLRSQSAALPGSLSRGSFTSFLSQSGSVPSPVICSVACSRDPLLEPGDSTPTSCSV